MIISDFWRRARCKRKVGVFFFGNVERTAIANPRRRSVNLRIQSMKCTKRACVSWSSSLVPCARLIAYLFFFFLRLRLLAIGVYFLPFLLARFAHRTYRNRAAAVYGAARNNRRATEIIKAESLFKYYDISFGTYRFTIALIANGTGRASEEKRPSSTLCV